ncbi:hypothetical protein V6N13_123759 [Hibiscus sabdariffa]
MSLAFPKQQILGILRYMAPSARISVHSWPASVEFRNVLLSVVPLICSNWNFVSNENLNSFLIKRHYYGSKKLAAIGSNLASYFHSIVKGKKQRSSISMLKDDDGSWCSDGCILRENATNYFENFFDCPEPTVPHFPIRGRFPKHSTAELANPFTK